MSKSCQSCQNIVKKLSKKNLVKNLSKMFVKNVRQKFALLLRLSGEEGEEEEEDWWILDQVATSSHLVKMASETRTIL
jgi:hypothetical protein